MGYVQPEVYLPTMTDIAIKLQGKTKEERLQWYDEHRDEWRRAYEHERFKARWLDGGGY